MAELYTPVCLWTARPVNYSCEVSCDLGYNLTTLCNIRKCELNGSDAHWKATEAMCKCTSCHAHFVLELKAPYPVIFYNQIRIIASLSHFLHHHNCQIEMCRQYWTEILDIKYGKWKKSIPNCLIVTAKHSRESTVNCKLVILIPHLSPQM